jgi:hypothetical protein
MRVPVMVLCALVLLFSAVRADEPASSCASDPAFAMLDFWLGDWDVYVGDTLAGSNHIEKILDGCAVTEDWTSASGSRGHSLFYYLPADQSWKQVWVTGNALSRGGVKEKTLIESTQNSVRFQGEIRLAGGGGYLDRTTLTSLENGEVRQLIEISTDGGKEWRAMFDGRYVRKK